MVNISHRISMSLVALLIFIPSASRASGVDLRPDVPASIMANDFFGFHMHRPRSAADLPIAHGSWRLWDSEVQWADIEPERGVFDFRRLDRLVNFAKEKRIKLLLPLGFPPTWASSSPTLTSPYGFGRTAPPLNNEDWQIYVETLVKRYAGVIEAYEMWNEPDLRMFYVGSTERLVELQEIASRIIKRIDPGALLISASPSSINPEALSWFKQYVYAGGLSSSDVIGLHLYSPTDGPEQTTETAKSVLTWLRRIDIVKPLWNTETGWRIRDKDGKVTGTRNWAVIQEDVAADYFVRAYLLSSSAGVKRYYLYAWDNWQMGLTHNGELNAAGRAVRDFASRFVGWSASNCTEVKKYGVAIWPDRILLMPLHNGHRTVALKFAS